MTVRYCYDLIVCLLKNSYVEILNPSVIMLQVKEFCRWLGPEGGTRVNGTFKRDPQSSLAASTMWGTARKLSGNQNESHHHTPNLSATWAWNLQPLELWEYISVVYKLPSIRYFCHSRPNMLRKSIFQAFPVSLTNRHHGISNGSSGIDQSHAFHLTKADVLLACVLWLSQLDMRKDMTADSSTKVFIIVE